MSKKQRSVVRPEIESDYSAFNRDRDRSVENAYRRAREIGGEFGGGLDPRRRQEAADAGLIREDHTQMANLPRMAQHHEFPVGGYYMTPYLDATRLEGVENRHQFVNRLIVKIGG
ncbi:MAG: hypothetical protein EHM20_17650 [Alphaproteobacteria bacterium]|nr:MAG: hypothetical protein EHM20_17650 [Alphaproteobacteria bacterium]